MCKLSDCYFWLYIILFIDHLVRFILSLIITIDTGFGEDVVILSIFSLLCCIIIFIAFAFLAIAYSYSSDIYISTKDYIYTYHIDVTKEDYRDTQARHKNQDYYFNWYIRISFISLFFSLGAIEETFRTDMLNKTYYDRFGVPYDYDSTKYILYTIEAIAEIILMILLKCLQFFNKKK